MIVRETRITLDSGGRYAARDRPVIAVDGDNLTAGLVLTCPDFLRVPDNAGWFVKLVCGEGVSVYKVKDRAVYETGEVRYTLRRNAHIASGVLLVQVQAEWASGDDVAVWQSDIVRCLIGASIDTDNALTADDAPWIQDMYQQMAALDASARQAAQDAQERAISAAVAAEQAQQSNSAAQDAAQRAQEVVDAGLQGQQIGSDTVQRMWLDMMA